MENRENKKVFLETNAGKVYKFLANCIFGIRFDIQNPNPMMAGDITGSFSSELCEDLLNNHRDRLQRYKKENKEYWEDQIEKQKKQRDKLKGKNQLIK